MIKISVIIPIYNIKIEDFEKCLNSVLQQSLKDIEIICILDGYKKSLLNYLNKASEADKRIKVIQQKNKGAGIARNNGIKKASGDFIAFMDSDDYYPEKDVLEYLYNLAQTKNVDIAGGKVLNDIQGKLEAPFWRFKNYERLFTNQIANINDYQICWGYWCFIYKKDLIIKNSIYFPSYRRYQDPPWFVRILAAAETFYAADKITYIHREHEYENIINADNKIKDHFLGIENILKFAAKQNLNDLHVFIYRKFLTYDVNLLKHLKPSIFTTNKSLVNKILKAVNPQIIESNKDEKLPLFKNYETYINNIKQHDIIDF